jgi:hypothetical protein
MYMSRFQRCTLNWCRPYALRQELWSKTKCIKCLIERAIEYTYFFFTYIVKTKAREVVEVATISCC